MMPDEHQDDNFIVRLEPNPESWFHTISGQPCSVSRIEDILSGYNAWLMLFSTDIALFLALSHSPTDLWIPCVHGFYSWPWECCLGEHYWLLLPGNVVCYLHHTPILCVVVLQNLKTV